MESISMKLGLLGGDEKLILKSLHLTCSLTVGAKQKWLLRKIQQESPCSILGCVMVE